MSIRSLLVLLCLGLGTSLQAQADRRGGVWVFRAESPRYYNQGYSAGYGQGTAVAIGTKAVRISTIRAAPIRTIRSTRATCRRAIRASCHRSITTVIAASSAATTGVRSIAISGHTSFVMAATIGCGRTTSGRALPAVSALSVLQGRSRSGCAPPMLARSGRRPLPAVLVDVWPAPVRLPVLVDQARLNAFGELGVTAAVEAECIFHLQRPLSDSFRARRCCCQTI